MNRSKVIKLLVCLLVTTILINISIPAVSYADGKTAKSNVAVSAAKASGGPRVVVSMGDSYSSGEGITPFYGSSDYGNDVKNPNPEFVEWLAHRSQDSWPGRLKLKDVGVMKDHKASNNPNHKENDKLHWYFVASSGAETKDICGDPKNGWKGQEKRYSSSVTNTVGVGNVYKTNLEPQINVLLYLQKKGIVPDYITLTLGGNDLGFEKIIEEAYQGHSSYQMKGNLFDMLDKAQEKLDKSVKQKLKTAYTEINNAAKNEKTGRQPNILVAGYPWLVDPNGQSKDKKYFSINADEAKAINKKVDYFNKTLKELVEECEKLNIWFVDVNEMSDFKNHAAYSNEEWINPIDLLPNKTDINHALVYYDKETKEVKLNMASASSMHPNYEGARQYAICVQKVIDSIENSDSATPSETTLTPLTKEQIDKAFSNYININHPEQIDYINKGGEAPVGWWISDIENNKTVVTMRFYTGSYAHYYVDVLSGETYVTETLPNEPNDEEHEHLTDEKFNIRDYLNQTMCTPTPIPHSPEITKDTSDNEPWRKAYIDFLTTDEDVAPYEDEYGICTKYTLIYLDDDSIPEIFVDTGFEAGGEYILTYYNGKVIKESLSRTGSEYIERSGLVYTNTGHMEYYPLTITKLENGVFTVIGKGVSYISEEDYKKRAEDENYHPSLTYEWEGKKVTEDQYNAKVAELYDLNKSKVPDNYYTYDEFVKLLKSGK